MKTPSTTNVAALRDDNAFGLADYVDNVSYTDTLTARSRLRDGFTIDAVLLYTITAV